jgi:hypothetical protein
VLVAAACAAVPASAAPNKGGRPAAPPKTTHAPASGARAPQTTHGAPHTATAPKSSPKTTTTTHGNPHPTTSPKSTTATTTKAHGNPHATTTASSTTATTSSQPETATTPTNPIAEKLQNKPLGARLEQMLPAGMTLDTASSGFKNQGQFIAAMHVSQNLGIPFADLKATMLGTPVPTATVQPTSPMSLGQAIQRLKPFANATTEAARAETQATSDLQTSSTATTTTTTTTTKKTRARGK